MGVSIGERLLEVRAGIAAACAAAGRATEEVTLVAVSKKHSPERIREAYAAGQRDFGENYAQELRDKARALSDLPEIRWHFIGRIQSNKARYIVPLATRVHTVDSVPHALALAKRAREGPVPCLVEVNLSLEATKAGTTEGEALALCEALRTIEGIDLKGLMTMPPYVDDPEVVAPLFVQLADLAAEGRRRGLPLHELSMGMTSDYPVAIRHGATWVRIGTAIFGPRR
jgi:pyridoxal phosphate enzyme (YggS family)